MSDQALKVILFYWIEGWWGGMHPPHSPPDQLVPRHVTREFYGDMTFEI